jgi:hypothetical protein
MINGAKRLTSLYDRSRDGKQTKDFAYGQEMQVSDLRASLEHLQPFRLLLPSSGSGVSHESGEDATRPPRMNWPARITPTGPFFHSNPALFSLARPAPAS